jgi:hypothetical protein
LRLPFKSIFNTLPANGLIERYTPRLQLGDMEQREIYLRAGCCDQIKNLPASAYGEKPEPPPDAQLLAHFDDYCRGEDWYEWDENMKLGHYKKRDGLHVITTRSVRAACFLFPEEILLCLDVQHRATFNSKKGAGLTSTQWYRACLTYRQECCHYLKKHENGV